MTDPTTNPPGAPQGAVPGGAPAAAAPTAPGAGAAAPAASAAAPTTAGGAAPHAFAELQNGAGQAGSEAHLSVLYDLDMPISVELGRTSMSVRDLLKLARGAVVQLDRLAGEPVDVFVGERKMAEGEVVVLGDHFGVRLTRVLSTPTTQASGQ